MCYNINKLLIIYVQCALFVAMLFSHIVSMKSELRLYLKKSNPVQP